jgi:putative transposase
VTPVTLLHVDTVLLKGVYVLVFIEHGTRRMHLTLGERFEDIRLLIRDRGPNFLASFGAAFEAAGTRILLAAVQALRMNSICGRLVGTLRRELLDQVLIFGKAIGAPSWSEYQVTYDTARPHQGIAQRVPAGEHDGSHLTVAGASTAGGSSENPSWAA